jgi:hypothetical protein
MFQHQKINSKSEGKSEWSDGAYLDNSSHKISQTEEETSN